MGGDWTEKKYLKRYPLGNTKRNWKQDKFILSTFSPASLDFRNFDPNGVDHTRRAVQNCANAGFNLLELGWHAALPHLGIGIGGRLRKPVSDRSESGLPDGKDGSSAAEAAQPCI